MFPHTGIKVNVAKLGYDSMYKKADSGRLSESARIQLREN